MASEEKGTGARGVLEAKCRKAEGGGGRRENTGCEQENDAWN